MLLVGRKSVLSMFTPHRVEISDVEIKEVKKGRKRALKFILGERMGSSGSSLQENHGERFKNTSRRTSINDSEQLPRPALEFNKKQKISICSEEGKGTAIDTAQNRDRNVLESVGEECISDKAGCSRNKPSSPELEKDKSNSYTNTLTNSLVASSTCNDPPKSNSTERIKSINLPGSEFIKKKSSGLSSPTYIEKKRDTFAFKLKNFHAEKRKNVRKSIKTMRKENRIEHSTIWDLIGEDEICTEESKFCSDLSEQNEENSENYLNENEAALSVKPDPKMATPGIFSSCVFDEIELGFDGLTDDERGDDT